MRGFIIISAIIFGFTLTGFGQTSKDSIFKRNSLYAEGYLIRHDFSDGFVSLNFERNIGKKHRTNLRLGIYPDFGSTVFSFPLTVSWVTKPLSQHHFEYGIGTLIRIEHYVSPYKTTTREWFYDVPALMIPLMYRYQQNSGWFFRGGVNVFISWPTLISPSVSVGHRL